MKIGILGGTFDPIHLGHVEVAKQTLAELDIDRILFIPTGTPWMKAGSQITEGMHRRKMVQLSIAGQERMDESGIEIARGGLTFTIDTLRHLINSQGKKDELFLIIGADAASSMHRWKEAGEILDSCTVVVVSRPEQTAFNEEQFNKIRPGASARAIRINSLAIDISGEKIREMVKSGISISKLVDPAVERYIINNNLYRGETDG